MQLLLKKCCLFIKITMKISAMAVGIILSLSAQLWAVDLFAQQVKNARISMSNQALTLESLLLIVEQQSGYRLMYNPLEIRSQQTIAMPGTSMELPAILQILDKQYDLGHRLDNGNLFIVKLQQTGTVKGLVSDNHGMPLIGANVRVKGTTLGVATDLNGMYTLDLRPGTYTLIFSFLGHKPFEKLLSVETKGEYVVNAVLEGFDMLQEVQVSYGKQARKEVTGSISTVNVDGFQDMPVTNFAQQLQGRVAGVQILQTSGQPGRGMSWRIRGAASLSSSNAPLFVVDGMPITGDINNINPAEIESFTVLKDASATALYGSRASNGVVLVKTKQATASSGVSVELNTNFGLQEIPSRGLPRMMNAREYATFMKERYDDMIRYEGFTGKIPQEYQNPEQYGEGTDWFAALTRRAPIQRYDVSIKSGSEKSSTTVVAGFQSQKGVVINSGFKLFSARLNQEYRMADNRLQLGFSLAPSYRMDHNNRLEDGIQGIVQKASEASPLFPIFDENGQYTQFVSSPGMVNYINPVARYELTRDDYNTTRILGNANFRYTILEGLTLSGMSGIDMGREMRQFFAARLLYTDGAARGTSSSVENYSNTNELNLSYNRSFGDHHFDLLAGYSTQSFRQQSNTVSGQGFASDEVPYLNVASTITGGSSGMAGYSLLSWLGRINYNYQQRYLLSFAVRRDGSSRFGRDERYGYFPSVSAGWVVSDEAFMQSVRAISFLKLRSSYGITGNNNIGNYTHIPQLANSDYVINGGLAPGTTITSLGNSRLAWERSRQFDIGLDLSLFGDRFYVNYDYYIKQSDGLIQARPIDRASGFASITANVGEIKFSGHEVAIGGEFRFGGLTWNTDLNLSFHRNRIERLVSPGFFRRNNTVSSDYYRNQVGHPLGMFFGFVHDGLYRDAEDVANSASYNGAAPGTLKIRDLNGDDIIDERDRTFIGDPNPDMLFGLTNRLKYGRFDLSLLINGSVGGDIILPAKWAYLTNLDGARNVLADAVNRWRSEEQPGNGIYPRTLSGTTAWGRNVSTLWVEDGSYLALKNLTLGYHFKLRNAFFKSLRAYTSVQNVFVLTNYSGMNPEISLDGLRGTSIGIDENAYPVPRIYSLGLNVSFK